MSYLLLSVLSFWEMAASVVEDKQFAPVQFASEYHYSCKVEGADGKKMSYSHGDVIKIRSHTCSLGNRKIWERKEECVQGHIETRNVERNCLSTEPYCCQIGKAGNDDAAKCVESDRECVKYGDATHCGENEHVVDTHCQPCGPGQKSAGGHSKAATNTDCNPILCAKGMYVVDHICRFCPIGKDSDGGHDASGDDTDCFSILCLPGYRVSNHICVPCLQGQTSDPDADAAAGDTDCTDTRRERAFIGGLGESSTISKGLRFDRAARRH